MEKLLAAITSEGPKCSSDFERTEAISWWWGRTTAVRAVLEALSVSGRLSLSRREGNRRYYDLTERLYPADLLEVRVPPREQRLHKMLSRYRAHGLLGASGSGEVWLGIGPVALRTDLRNELLDRGELVEVSVEGVRGARFIVADEMPLLAQAAARSWRPRPPGRGRASPASAAPGCSFLAPLDPLMWDRSLLVPALRLRLSLGGLHPSRQAPLGLLRPADPVRRPAGGPHRAAHRQEGRPRSNPGPRLGAGLRSARGTRARARIRGRAGGVHAVRIGGRAGPAGRRRPPRSLPANWRGRCRSSARRRRPAAPRAGSRPRPAPPLPDPRPAFRASTGRSAWQVDASCEDRVVAEPITQGAGNGSSTSRHRRLEGRPGDRRRPPRRNHKRRLQGFARHLGVAHRAGRRPHEPGGAARGGPRKLLLDGVLEASSPRPDHRRRASTSPPRSRSIESTASGP